MFLLVHIGNIYRLVVSCLLAVSSILFFFSYQTRDRGERLAAILASPHLSHLTEVRGQPYGPASTNQPPVLAGTDQWRGRIWRAINQCRALVISGLSGTDEVGGGGTRPGAPPHTDMISDLYHKLLVNISKLRFFVCD